MSSHDNGGSGDGHVPHAQVQPGVRAEWLDGIVHSIDELRTLNEKTEESFLSVGSQLQNIFTLTMGISDNLTQVMNNFSSDGQSQLTAKMRQISETSARFLSNFDSTSRYAVDHLGSVMQIIDELPATLKEFDRLVSQLRIMGITTRIETERLGLHNMGFEHLADEVTTLGESISKKAKEVQVSIRTIFSFVKVNEQNLVRLRSKHQGLQISVARNMNEDLQLLGEKHEVLVNVVENISRQSQDSVHSVNTIVGALQFHDITRQQIEHVVDALKDLHMRITEGGDDDPMPYLILVCELQPAQLQRARSEFMNAVLSLISSFGNLSNTIAMMQAESGEAIGFADGDGSTFFSVIGANLQNVTKALIEGEKGIHEFLDSLEQIEKVVENMKTYMAYMDLVVVRKQASKNKTTRSLVLISFSSSRANRRKSAMIKKERLMIGTSLETEANKYIVPGIRPRRNNIHFPTGVIRIARKTKKTANKRLKILPRYMRSSGDPLSILPIKTPIA